MMLAAIYHPILAVLFAFVALLLMIVILLQRGKGVGLAGAFGGAGGQSAFGAKTGDFLTWVTVGIAIVFLLFAIALNYVFQPGTPVIAAPAQPVPVRSDEQTPVTPPTPVEQTPVTPATPPETTTPDEPATRGEPATPDESAPAAPDESAAPADDTPEPSPPGA